MSHWWSEMICSLFNNQFHFCAQFTFIKFGFIGPNNFAVDITKESNVDVSDLFCGLLVTYIPCGFVRARVCVSLSGEAHVMTFMLSKLNLLPARNFTVDIIESIGPLSSLRCWLKALNQSNPSMAISYAAWKYTSHIFWNGCATDIHINGLKKMGTTITTIEYQPQTFMLLIVAAFSSALCFYYSFVSYLADFSYCNIGAYLLRSCTSLMFLNETHTHTHIRSRLTAMLFFYS